MSRMIAVPGRAGRTRALFCRADAVNRLVGPIVVILAGVVSVGSAEEPPPSAPYMVRFSPDGRRLAVATGKPDSKVALTVWDTAKLVRLWVVRDRQGIPAVAFAPDGQTLVVGRFSGEAKMYDSAAGKLRATYTGHGTVARAVGFAPDGKLLAVGSYEGFIKMWDSARGAEVRTLRGHNGRIYEVVFSPDGTRLLSVGIDAARLWDVGTGREQHALRHGGSLVHAGLFAPDGRSVVTGGWDGTLRFWDADTGAQRWRLESRGGVNALAYAPSRDMLVIGGNSRRIELVSPMFRERDASQRLRLEVLLVQLDDDSYAVREAASREILEMGLTAEPWLSRLMTESQSAEVRLRCRHLRQQILTTTHVELSGHGDEVESVALALDGNVLASVDRSGTVLLWDVATRRVRAHFVPSETAGQFDDNSSRRAGRGQPSR
jgi:WD40 repeat protein